MNYLLHLSVLLSVYLLLAQSLNIVLGYCGLFSLGHAALWGLGAYTSAILSQKCMLYPPASWVAAAGLSAVASLCFSLPAGRLKGDSFALASLAFQVAVLSLLTNAVELTGGPFGISGIPRPTIFGVALEGPSWFSLFAMAIALVGILLTRLVAVSPFGRVMVAIRDDELAALALGKRVLRTRVSACAFAGALAGLAGAIYASYMSFIDPSSFGLNESFLILSIVLIGGSGNLLGPCVGAVIAIGLPECLRFCHIPSTIGANIHQVMFGAFLVVLMLLRPQGLCGRYRQE